MPNYTKTEKFVKTLFHGEKHSFIEWTYGVGAHWNSNVHQQHTLLKFRKRILKYTLNKYHVHWLSSFKHLKLPISIKIPVTIYLHGSYITKFDFMNYAFAELLVAW